MLYAQQMTGSKTMKDCSPTQIHFIDDKLDQVRISCRRLGNDIMCCG